MRIAISSISFCEYLIEQANGLAGLGHSVLLIMPAPLVASTVGKDLPRCIASRVQIHTYPVVGKWNPSFYQRLFRAITSFSPDLLHIHENGEIETFAFLMRFIRAPLVLTIHDVTPHAGADSKTKWRRRFVKKLLRRKATLIHLHGNWSYNVLEKQSERLAEKAVIIPHGTLSLFKIWEEHEIEREPLTCLFFGRMERYRGLDNLVKIGGQLKDFLPGIRIVVAGNGSELHRYKTEMKNLGIFEIHNSFIPDPEVHRYFRRASLLLLPYHEATQSGVVAIGLAFGTPVVATDVGSISETLIDGQHGKIVPRGDLNSFVTAIRELLVKEDERKRMEQACYQLGDSLSFKCLAGQFVRLYERATFNH